MHIDDEVLALLRHLDHPTPEVRAATIIAVARERPLHWVRWAATIVLALAVAGGAYALPGSPLRSWIQKLTHKAPPAPQGHNAAVPGIAVTPGLDFVVHFTRPQPTAQIDVVLTEGAEVEVHAVTGTAGFRAGTDTLIVDNWDSRATFDVRIPRAAPRVQVVVGDRRIWPRE
jgi:hypothetical protein